jgi:K+/H+ antiporter YhaU regulatory subunit KhtT
LRTADARLDHMHTDGLLSTHIWERLKLYINQNAAVLGTAMRELLLSDPALEAEELDTGWRELNRAQRSALLGLRRDGVISEEAFEQLTTEVDAQMDEVPALPEDGNAPTQFLEVTIRSDSHASGKAIADLDLPRAAVFVSIRREEEILIPRGDTILQAGDVVTTLCERGSVTAVKKLLVSRSAPKSAPESKSS